MRTLAYTRVHHTHTQAHAHTHKHTHAHTSTHAHSNTQMHTHAHTHTQGPYGRDFRYTEMMSGGQGWAGFLKAALVSSIMTVGGIAISTQVGQWLLKKCVRMSV